MTREEAIEEIKRWTPILLNSGQCTEETSKAQDMAISALSNKGEDSKVAKGQWIKFENGYKCSECGHIMDKVLSVSGNLIYQYSNYCPECGKKMSLEEPTEEEVQAFWLEAINSRCM